MIDVRWGEQHVRELATLGAAHDGLGAARLVDLALDRLNAAASKTVYARAMRDFLGWCVLQPAARFDKATVQRYRAELIDASLAPPSINQRLCAIRAWPRKPLHSGNAFASYTRTAPIPASSAELNGRPVHHRLNRHGNRSLNSVLHIMAVTRPRTRAETQALIARATANGRRAGMPCALSNGAFYVRFG